MTGKAGGFSVSATDKVPHFPSAGVAPQGSTSTPISIPPTLPIGDVKGTIGGAHFTLELDLELSQLSRSSKSDIGTATGTFRNQKVSAILTADPTPGTLDFSGTIGSLHVSGVIRSITRHGNKATARASFEITK